MKVLMGVEDSPSSSDLVQAVVKQFRTENTEITVLHVLQPLALGAPPHMDPGYAPELEDQIGPARELVEQIVKDLENAGFKASTAIKLGDVRECILDLAAECQADLILVGSHGTGGIARFLLGSVAESVARHASCSVEIVRRR
jgi:nucleotide-binding universal stress UspA family protein